MLTSYKQMIAVWYCAMSRRSLTSASLQSLLFMAAESDNSPLQIVSRELWEQRLLRAARFGESKLQDTVHCLRPNCEGFAEVIDGHNYVCPVCEATNCLRCKAIHGGQSCREYQASRKRDAGAHRTRQMLRELLKKGKAMKCPGCKMIVQKEDGCDWMVCGKCGMELCWPTKGARWGPKGTNDTSGGCRCRVNGKKCHPDCNYCH